MRITRKMIGIGLALGTAAPVAATSFQLRIAPSQGPMLTGPAGLHALDIRTDDTLIRVIAAGTRIDKRGTIRVLVMNLGKPAYQFGPDEVAIELADGTALQEVPVAVFEQGHPLVEREVSRSAAIVRGGAQQPVERRGIGEQRNDRGNNQWAPAGTGDVRGESLQHHPATVASELPGGKLLDDLNGVLRPLTIGPKQAWGGHLVFDPPRHMRRGSLGQSVTIVVRTGGDVQRIKATLGLL